MFIKKIFFLLVFLAINLMCENKKINKDWFLGIYEISEDEKKQKTMIDKINSIVQMGFTPTGIEIKNNLIYVLFSKHTPIQVSSWVLYQFSLDEVKDGITQFILKDYIPMDMVFKGKIVFGLFVKDKNKLKISGWKTETIPFEDVKSATFNIKKSMSTLSLLRYIPFGLTQIAKNKLSFLYLKVLKSKVFDYFLLKTYPNDGSLASSIEEEVKKGLAPWGISLINNEVWITYIKK